jgi:hypothetical protein
MDEVDEEGKREEVEVKVKRVYPFQGATTWLLP